MLLIFSPLLCLKTRNRIDYYSLLNKAGTKKSSRLKYRKLIRERYTFRGGYTQTRGEMSKFCQHDIL